MPWFVWDCPSFSAESSTESLGSGEMAQFQGRWTPYLEGRTLPEAQLQGPDWGRVWVQKLLRDQQHFPTRTGDRDSHDSHPKPPPQMRIHRHLQSPKQSTAHTPSSRHPQEHRYTHSDSRRQLRLTDPRPQKQGWGGGVDTDGHTQYTNNTRWKYKHLRTEPRSRKDRLRRETHIHFMNPQTHTDEHLLTETDRHTF